MKKIEEIKFAGVIPARYQSSRFPGKPLADLCGKPVIEHVYTRASKSLDNLVVATDDQRIFECVENFGGKACMTSPMHKSGTDRCREAALKTFPDADVIINIQGDEPFIDPAQIEILKKSFINPETDIATLVRKFDPSLGFEALFDPNLVKVTIDDNGFAMYFSRSIIPYVRNVKWQDWLSNAQFLTHIGIYAYRMDVLGRIASLPQSTLEKAESLEQLRWLQAGYKIAASVSDSPTVGIDTPEDLEYARKVFADFNS